MDRYIRPGWFTRHVLNPAVALLTRTGISVWGSRILAVRGRKSGEWRTTPVNLLEHQANRYLVAPRGTTQWVRNLRTAGEATLTVGRKRERVIATELSVEERARFFRDVIGPYARRLRVGGLLLSALGAKEILDDPAQAAEHRPVFELRAA